VLPMSVATGVAHGAGGTASTSEGISYGSEPRARARICAGVHGGEVDPLPRVRGTDARSWEIVRPDGVARSFQISRNNVEPSEAVRARNLLSNEDRRQSLCDELEPRGPEVSIVAESGDRSVLLRLGEWLAGTGSAPQLDAIGPAGGPSCGRPEADAGEGVELVDADEVGGGELEDRSIIDASGGDVPVSHEIAEPLGGIGIALIEQSRHSSSRGNVSSKRAC
jgi:hypothetical protein